MIHVNRARFYLSGLIFRDGVLSTHFSWTLIFIVLALAGSLSLESCIGVTANPRTVSRDPNLRLSVNPSSVNFGDVRVGNSSTQSITLTNTGTGVVTVSQAIITGVSLSETGLTLPLTLSAGQSGNFNVAFAPNSVGTLSGSITVVSNASNSPATIALSGTGVNTVVQLSVNPSSLNFGNVVVGGSSTQPVTLSNTGNSVLNISQINVIGATFSVSGVALPLTLASGETTSFNVRFGPNVSANITGTISVVSTAANSPSTVSLSGSGIQSIAHSVTLSWMASDEGAGRYNVYRSTQSGTAYSKLNSVPSSGLSYTDTTVQGGQTYFYVVTAVDNEQEESTFSEESSATIPLP